MEHDNLGSTELLNPAILNDSSWILFYSMQHSRYISTAQFLTNLDARAHKDRINQAFENAEQIEMAMYAVLGASTEQSVQTTGTSKKDGSM